MQMKAYVLAATLAVVAAAQAPAGFKARLSPVALELAQIDAITGSGQATAALAGTKLTVSGSFEGMKSAATAAHIHRGTVTGVRGPVLFELTVDKAAGGKFSGSFDLTAEQADSLKKGRMYVQIHSQSVPDGNLWGWLLQ